MTKTKKLNRVAAFVVAAVLLSTSYLARCAAPEKPSEQRGQELVSALGSEAAPQAADDKKPAAGKKPKPPSKLRAWLDTPPAKPGRFQGFR